MEGPGSGEGAPLEALAEAFAEPHFETHDPVPIDGVPIGTTLVPPDGEALAGMLRALTERRWGAVVRGGGSRLDLGNPPRAARVLLSTRRLSGVDVFDAEEGVAHAAAGTPLRELAALAAGSGWEVPFDPPGRETTLGGTLAAAAAGPRQLGFGRPRDLVLGLEVALPDGTRTKCGGRVVKNVTGYDLMKLQIGALGTLGVIEGAWIRLRPAPERVALWEAWLPDAGTALACGLEAARLTSARAVATIGSRALSTLAAGRPGAGPLLVVELAGSQASVARDAEPLAKRFGAQPAAPERLEAVRRLQGGESARDGALRFRIGARSARLARAIAPLEAAGVAWLAYPGVGVCFAFSGGEGGSEAAWRLAADAARGGGGPFVLESGPLSAKAGRDVFGDPPAHLALLRAVKQRFDPEGILNPGRFVGGL